MYPGKGLPVYIIADLSEVTWMRTSKHILLLAVILMICCNCNSRSDKLNKTTQEPSVIDVNQIKTDAASEDYELYPDALKVIGFMEYDPDYEFIILDALTDEDLHRKRCDGRSPRSVGRDCRRSSRSRADGRQRN